MRRRAREREKRERGKKRGGKSLARPDLFLISSSSWFAFFFASAILHEEGTPKEMRSACSSRRSEGGEEERRRERERERERWQAREKTATTTPDRRSWPDLEASIPSIPSPLFLRSPHLACHFFWRIAVERSRLGPCSWFEAANARQQDAKVLEDSGEEGKKKDSKGLVARLVSVAARRSSP